MKWFIEQVLINSETVEVVSGEKGWGTDTFSISLSDADKVQINAMLPDVPENDGPVDVAVNLDDQMVLIEDMRWSIIDFGDDGVEVMLVSDPNRPLLYQRGESFYYPYSL